MWGGDNPLSPPRPLDNPSALLGRFGRLMIDGTRRNDAV